MEKLLKKLNVLYNIVQILFLTDKINQAVRDHIVAIIGEMEFQLKKTVEDDFKGIMKSSSQSKEFVNKHINLADTNRILHELQRRNVGWNKEDCDEDDSSRLRGSVIGDNSRTPSGL